MEKWFVLGGRGTRVPGANCFAAPEVEGKERVMVKVREGRLGLEEA